MQFAGQDAYGLVVTATASTLRARIYALLRYTDPTPAARQWRAVNLLVLGIGLVAVILLSVDELDARLRSLLRTVIWSVTFIPNDSIIVWPSGLCPIVATAKPSSLTFP